MEIGVKRVYEPPADEDGCRILVDRIWPRGVKKDQAGVAIWLKEVAPSDGLRRWFGHDPERWPEFRRRYRLELEEKKPIIEELLSRAGKERVTLLFAARDEERNNAVVLRDYLQDSR